MRAAHLAGGAALSVVETLLSSAYTALESNDVTSLAGKDTEIADFEAMLHDDPPTYKAAMASPDASRWKQSMAEEWNSILENQTFRAFEEQGELTPIGANLRADQITPLSCPMAARPISSKWVYKTKRNPDGSTRFKSRLVICGFQQVEGIDYGETYAPVSRLTSFRLLISLAACYGWAIDHLDVVTAFLNPKIDREHVYMLLPPGLDWLDPRFSAISVVLLLKALYGLKQAPRLWYEEINRFLLSIGLLQSKTDPNLYIGPGVLLLLYVDDIIVAHTLPNGADAVKIQLQQRYKMTDLGRAKRFLGIEISQTPDGISLCQREYVQKVLRRFRMERCHSALTPMVPNVRLSNTICEDKAVTDRKGYLSMVGSLMYAALGTRPDLSYCVTALSRYNSTPLQMHLTAAKRALRYLKGTDGYKLYYPRVTVAIALNSSGPSSWARIHGFTDSDWAGNELTRKSVGGCVFFAETTPEHGDKGPLTTGAIHWQCKTQTVVALSTLEAEYIACSDAVREAIWVRRLLQDIGTAVAAGPTRIVEPPAVQIGCDNQGALKLIETGVSK